MLRPFRWRAHQNTGLCVSCQRQGVHSIGGKGLDKSSAPVELSDLQYEIAMHDRVFLEAVVIEAGPDLPDACIEDLLGVLHVLSQATIPEQSVWLWRL